MDVKECNPSREMEEKKRYQRISKEKNAECTSSRPRKRKECDIPDEERCKGLDKKKNWRCSNARVNRNYCQHHVDLMTKNYQCRRERKKREKENKDGAMVDPIPLNKQPKKQSQDVTVPDPFPCTKQYDVTLAVAITKRSINNTGRIRNPEIVQQIMVTSKISDLKELPLIMMCAWTEGLTPAERYGLRAFLPEGHRDECAVISLFGEKISRFGIDLAGKWCRSVCEGKESPDLVLQKERELKIFQSQFFNDLRKFRDDFISEAESLKRLCLETCGGDDKMFRKELERTSHDLTVIRL